MPGMSAILSELPLFPLGTVLFPGGLLPLRIFEVRYLDMVGRCHKAGMPFGVVSLSRGSEVRSAEGDDASQEAFCEVGTLARIIEFSMPQAGLMLIRCEGTERFRLRSSERLKHGLWTGDAELLPPDRTLTIPEDLEPVAQGLRKLVQQLQDQQVPSEQMPLLKPYRFDDCSWVANRWCELLPMSVEMRQRLMALDNPLVRLELVGDLLERTGWTG